MKKQTVAVIDFGSQYTQLIARRVREQNVYSEIFPHSITASELKKMDVSAVIFSGGPSSVYENAAPQVDNAILDLNIPVLGICYGLHLMISDSGGQVIHKGQGEYGFAKVHPEVKSPLFDNLSQESQVWMSHGDEIENIGNGFEVIARSSNNIIAAIQHHERPLYGVQFHPEVVHTIEGNTILSNFLFKISDCQADWTAEHFISETISSIQEKVGDDGKVITGISGGVDSSVVGTLLHKAIGDRSRCVFIDHGLLRKEEVNEETVNEIFSQSQMKQAIGIARKSSGNYTKAYNEIEKIKKGLGDEHIIQNALKKANESFSEDHDCEQEHPGKSHDVWIKSKEKNEMKDLEPNADEINAMVKDPHKSKESNPKDDILAQWSDASVKADVKAKGGADMSKVKDKAPISASYESKKYHDTKPGSIQDAVMQMQVNEQKSVTIRVDKLSALIETYLARGGVSHNLSPVIAEEKLNEVLPLQAVREFIDTYNRFFLTNYKAEEFIVKDRLEG